MDLKVNLISSTLRRGWRAQEVSAENLIIQFIVAECWWESDSSYSEIYKLKIETRIRESSSRKESRSLFNWRGERISDTNSEINWNWRKRKTLSTKNKIWKVFIFLRKVFLTELLFCSLSHSLSECRRRIFPKSFDIFRGMANGSTFQAETSMQLITSLLTDKRDLAPLCYPQNWILMSPSTLWSASSTEWAPPAHMALLRWQLQSWMWNKLSRKIESNGNGILQLIIFLHNKWLVEKKAILSCTV